MGSVPERRPSIDELRIHYPQLAPGVRGTAGGGDEYYEVWNVYAEVEGSGDVGRWIDSLHGDVCFMAVVSPRLIGMLRRRGFVEELVNPQDASPDAETMWRRIDGRSD